MRLSDEALALIKGDKGYHCGRVVLDFPGLFFVTEQPPDWAMPLPPGVVFIAPPKRRALEEALSDPNPGAKVIRNFFVQYKRIWGPDSGRWLLWAIKPDDYAHAVMRAMMSVLGDNDLRPNERGFWEAVLATLITEGFHAP